MTDQFYIRIRGRVQGPFDTEKLRNLARRGQFSRLFEVSPDGQQWQSAKEFPELFATPQSAVNPAGSSAYQATGNNSGSGSQGSTGASAATGTAGGSAGYQPASSSAPSPATWYYAYGGREQGPVDFQTLVSMFISRQLTPETEVWNQGMVQWVAASSVPGLVPANPSAAERQSNSTSTSSTADLKSSASDQVSETTIRILVESRPWVTFLSVMGFVYAAFMMAGGIFQLIIGARSGVFPVTSAGLMSMLMSLVIAFGSWLLVSFAGGISNLQRSRRTSTLDRALATLKTLWVYLGIILIVILTFAILMAIVIVSIAGSVAGSMPDFDT